MLWPGNHRSQPCCSLSQWQQEVTALRGAHQLEETGCAGLKTPSAGAPPLLHTSGKNEKKSQQARCIFLNNWIEVYGIHLLNKQNKINQSGADAAATSGRAGVSQGWRAWSRPRASPGSLRAAGPGLSEGALPTCWGGLGAPGPGESSVLSHRRGYEL